MIRLREDDTPSSKGGCKMEKERQKHSSSDVKEGKKEGRERLRRDRKEKIFRRTRNCVV